jgi:excisionase family DNA binding protein
MAERLLTVPQVAEEFQVTSQTIRNWIDSGTLPAIRVGRQFRLRRSDVDALLDRARADSDSHASQRDVWSAKATRMPMRRHGSAAAGVWEDAGRSRTLERP